MNIKTNKTNMRKWGTDMSGNTKQNKPQALADDPFYVPSTTKDKKEKEKSKPSSPEIMKKFNFKDIEPGDTIQGEVKFSDIDIVDNAFEVKKTTSNRKIVLDAGNPRGVRSVRYSRFSDDCILIKTSRRPTEKGKKLNPIERIMLKKDIEERVAADIIAKKEAGLINFWMVGPAGSGKTTIARMIAKALGYDFYIISCSIGTSAGKFEGYKYPTPRKTPFSYYYERPSVILIDEFPALDPAVAQSMNSALANDQMEITTTTALDGTDIIKRHKDCIIIGTSNTFGTGLNPLYNANNQLDGSTLDRFTGGIVNVDYSKAYESNFDLAVAKFVWAVRECIKENQLQRIASTRMIINGEKLKKYGFDNWASELLTGWSNKELLLLDSFLKNKDISIQLNLGISIDSNIAA